MGLKAPFESSIMKMTDFIAVNQTLRYSVENSKETNQVSSNFFLLKQNLDCKPN